MVFSDHPVFPELDQLGPTILVGVKGPALLHVVLPVPLVLGAVGVVKNTVAVPDSCGPMTLVPVTDVLALAFRLEPNVHAPTFLVVVFPFAYVLFPDVGPVHGAVALLLVVFPHSLKIVARRVVIHFSVALLEVILEGTFEDAATFKNDFSPSRLFTLEPLALVGCFLYRVLARAMPEAILDLAFVDAAIGPSVNSVACDAVVGELSFVLYSIGPGEFAPSVEQPVVELPLVLVAVLECNLSGTIEALAVDF